MPHGQLVLGPPGAGKSTYCHGLQQFLTALDRPITIVNLDPACPSPPYEHTISITSLITIQDAMEEFNLGPNGGLLYCMEYLERNIDWLMDELHKLGKDAYVAFDMPGQVELGTDHVGTKKVISALEKAGWRIAAVHLCDAHYITDASKYLAVLLLSLRTMLQLELPHINVLSKIDQVTSYSDLAFNLEFYTQVEDLSYLLPYLERDPRHNRFAALNRAICELVEDFGLVGFETLCVEDKKSMIHLVKAIDNAMGYIPTTTGKSYDMKALEGGQVQDANIPLSKTKAPTNTVNSVQAMMREHTDDPRELKSYVFDVQEKFVDSVDEFKDFDRENWEREGQEAVDVANELSRQEAVKRVSKEDQER